MGHLLWNQEVPCCCCLGCDQIDEKTAGTLQSHPYTLQYYPTQHNSYFDNPEILSSSIYLFNFFSVKSKDFCQCLSLMFQIKLNIAGANLINLSSNFIKNQLYVQLVHQTCRTEYCPIRRVQENKRGTCRTAGLTPFPPEADVIPFY